VRELEDRFASRFEHDHDRVVTVILDGENAWGAYAEDGRPFLHALYRELAATPAVQTVTFSEFLDGSSRRGLRPHPPSVEVHELFAGSWVDEHGSRPGVDLGTWIGEPQENRAWELLAAAREQVEAASGAARERALEAIYAAEGSDWFWWLGDDQAGNDEAFDELFRSHLETAYRALRQRPPDALFRSLVRPQTVWTFSAQPEEIAACDRLVVRTNCPGTLHWRSDGGAEVGVESSPVGDVLAGSRRFQATIGPFAPPIEAVEFRFVCSETGCTCRDCSCQGGWNRVEVRSAGASPMVAPAADADRSHDDGR
jgi:hypothetical protein